MVDRRLLLDTYKYQLYLKIFSYLSQEQISTVLKVRFKYEGSHWPSPSIQNDLRLIKKQKTTKSQSSRKVLCFHHRLESNLTVLNVLANGLSYVQE
jgi:hypothetical protein